MWVWEDTHSACNRGSPPQPSCLSSQNPWAAVVSLLCHLSQRHFFHSPCEGWACQSRRNPLFPCFMLCPSAPLGSGSAFAQVEGGGGFPGAGNWVSVCICSSPWVRESAAFPGSSEQRETGVKRLPKWVKNNNCLCLLFTPLSGEAPSSHPQAARTSLYWVDAVSACFFD